jgi:uncharacterized protein (DUF983 family)
MPAGRMLLIIGTVVLAAALTVGLASMVSPKAFTAIALPALVAAALAFRWIVSRFS